MVNSRISTHNHYPPGRLVQATLIVMKLRRVTRSCLFLALLLRCHQTPNALLIAPRLCTRTRHIGTSRTTTYRLEGSATAAPGLVLPLAKQSMLHSSSAPLSAAAAEEGRRSDRIAGLEFEKSIRREDRLAVLRDMNRSSAQDKELYGLLDKASVFEEQYKPLDFTESHREFKRAHNQAFVALCQFVGRRRRREQSNHDNNDIMNDDDMNIFFLDGQDAGTATALHAAGFAMSQLYVANRHESSCTALVEWGLLPENVACESAHLALVKAAINTDKSVAPAVAAGKFSKVNFGAFYFDGCGGYAPMIVEMLAAALDGAARERLLLPPHQTTATPIAIGFSVLGGGRDIVDKEQGLVQQLVVLAKRMNMTVSHVLDDPGRYGIEESLCKVDGSTLTSWFVLEPPAKNTQVE